MKCPLLSKYDTEELPIENPIPIDCLTEECAWWDKVGERCSVVSISRALEIIFMVLSGIRDKMPSDLLEELRLLVGAIGMLTDKMPPAK